MSTMRLGGVAAAAAMLAASTAQAEPAEFAGLYAGAHAGYVDAEADFDTGGELSAEGALGGFQVGANIATGNVIWGLETDISLTSADPDGTCPFLAAASCDVDVEGLATLRGRVGYVVMDDFLFYVTGGAAAARLEIESSGTINRVAFQTDDDDGKLGWTVGAGVEYLVGSSPLPGTKHVGVKLEYRYMDIRGFDIDRVPTLGKQSIDLESHAVMLGVNWHF